MIKNGSFGHGHGSHAKCLVSGCQRPSFKASYCAEHHRAHRLSALDAPSTPTRDGSPMSVAAKRLEQASLQFEAGASDRERKQAEAFLMHVRQSARPYGVCLELLQTSRESVAQFQGCSKHISSPEL
eukprot:g23769.t1